MGYIHNPVFRGAALVGQEDAQKAEGGVAVTVKDAALGEQEDARKAAREGAETGGQEVA